MTENESMSKNIEITHLKIIYPCVLYFIVISTESTTTLLRYLISLTDPRYEIISYIILASELWSDCTRGGVESSLEDFYQLYVGKIRQLNFKEKPGVLRLR